MKGSLFFFLLATQLWAADPCITNSLDDIINDVVPRGNKNPKGQALIEDMMAFAKEHNLPYKVVEFGPEERRVKRLLVGLDQTNDAVRDAYMARYQHTKPIGDGKDVEGVIPIEIQREDKLTQSEHYVTGVPRLSDNKEDMIWRWGRPDNDMPINYENWWNQWINGYERFDGHQANNHITAYSHLIPLNKAERENFQFFLDNRELRAPCKSDNCIAWVSNLELGKTAEGASAAERRHLFPELGVSRSMAHFEIGRRIMHAADDNHAGMMVFYRGDEGRKAFEERLNDFLPPEPKIPYSSIILSKIPDDAPVMKAMSVIEDGDKVYFPIASGASPEAMTALAQKAEDFENGVTAQMSISGLSESVIKRSQKGDNPKLKLESLFIGGNQREVNHAGKVNLIHGYLSDFGKRIRDPNDEVFKYDAIVVRVNPKKVKGGYSLGATTGNIMDIIKNNPDIKIIAEFNENVPLTAGDNIIPAGRITKRFKSDSQLASSPVVPLTQVEEEIGRHLGTLVDDGATLQLGIGNIFDGLPEGIRRSRARNLKISTEMFGDPLKKIVESGAVKEARTGFAFGSDGLYKWLDGNKDVRFVPQSVVNDLTKVRETEKFTAINTALQVDLRGNINATMGPVKDGKPRRISSPGGQVDFMSSASLAKDGKAVIAIRSTAKGGDLSTITLKTYGDEITTRSEFVTHVVTEYGVAELAGKTEAEKALELISVAHPKFRNDLLQEALDANIITKEQFDYPGSAIFRPEAPRTVSVWDTPRKLDVQAGEVNYKVLNPDAEETVVLIHGLGDSSETWEQTAKSFSDQGYRVVTYDQRGHGRTMAQGADFSNERMAADLEELLERLNIRKDITLVGHSMGGRTAIKYASRNPKKVRALVVEDMHAKKVYKGETEPGYFTTMMEEVKRDRLSKPQEFYEWISGNPGFYDKSRLASELREYVKDPRVRDIILDKHVIQMEDGIYKIQNNIEELRPVPLYHAGGLSEDLTGDLAKIKAPTLFLAASDESKVLFGKGVDHLVENINAKIVKVPNSGHGIHITNPDEFMSEILAFKREEGLPKPMRTVPAERTVLKLDPPRPLKISEMNYIDTPNARGETILFIHDVNKSAIDNQKEIRALQSAGYRVVAPDLRGHGKTLAQGNVYTPKVLAKDLQMLVDELGLQNFHTYSIGQAQKVADELKMLTGKRMKKSFHFERLPKVNVDVPNPREVQEVLERMPQVYNSSDELLKELHKHFSPSLTRKLYNALKIEKPNGDIVVNRALPIEWFIDSDFVSHFRFKRDIANRLNDVVTVRRGANLREMVKTVNKETGNKLGDRKWYQFFSP